MKLHCPAQQSPNLESQLAKPGPINEAGTTKNPEFKV